MIIVTVSDIIGLCALGVFLFFILTLVIWRITSDMIAGFKRKRKAREVRDEQ